MAVETPLVTGDPAEQLCKLARERDARLVAVGTRGHGTVRSLLLGSVSGAVIRRAPCPVLVVTASERRSDTRTGGVARKPSNRLRRPARRARLGRCSARPRRQPLHAHACVELLQRAVEQATMQRTHHVRMPGCQLGERAAVHRDRPAFDGRSESAFREEPPHALDRSCLVARSAGWRPLDEIAAPRPARLVRTRRAVRHLRQGRGEGLSEQLVLALPRADGVEEPSRASRALAPLSRGGDELSLFEDGEMPTDSVRMEARPLGELVDRERPPRREAIRAAARGSGRRALGERSFPRPRP